jgi:predicted kinase
MEAATTVTVQVIVISGSMGSGKTTVLGEASDLLSASGVVHAAIDLDALGSSGLPETRAAELVYLNLAAVWANFAKAGVSRLLLAEAVESSDDLAQIRAAIPGANLVVCRLTADATTAAQRLRVREPGMLQEKFLKRAPELDAVLERARLEDFSIVNDNRSITDVARELLTRARWIDQGPHGE